MISEKLLRNTQNIAIFTQKELYELLYSLGVGYKNERWLDLGTGTGVLPLNMYEFGADIIGVDISSEQIDAAKQLADERGVKNAIFLPVPQKKRPLKITALIALRRHNAFGISTEKK